MKSRTLWSLNHIARLGLTATYADLQREWPDILAGSPPSPAFCAGADWHSLGSAESVKLRSDRGWVAAHFVPYVRAIGLAAALERPLPPAVAGRIACERYPQDWRELKARRH